MDWKKKTKLSHLRPWWLGGCTLTTYNLTETEILKVKDVSSEDTLMDQDYVMSDEWADRGLTEIEPLM